MLARFQCLNRERNVKFIWDSNIDRIDRFVREKLLDRLMGMLERVFFLQSSAPLKMRILNGDQLSVGMAQDRFGGVISDLSGADETKANGG